MTGSVSSVQPAACPHPSTRRGPTFGSSEAHVLNALETRGELGPIALRLPSGNRPSPLGSGKFGTPWARMHSANRNIAFDAAACCAGVSCGGPPPGRNLRQAWTAAWNCGEPGSAFPVTVTPAIVIWLPVDPPAPEPTAAAIPCAVRHVASLAELGRTDVVCCWPAGVVVPRLATDGALAPPQPAATKTRAARAAMTAEPRSTSPYESTAL